MADWDVIATKPIKSSSPAPKPAPTPTAWDVASTKGPPEPSLASQALAPVKDIPHEIGEEFRAGKKDVAEAISPDPKAPLSTGKFLGGAMREVFAPITGTARAIVGKPVENITGSKMAGKVAEEGATLVGPGVVSKALAKFGEIMPGYTDAVRKLMDEGITLTPGQIARSVFKRGEDALRSFPVLGNMIDSAQFRSLTDFNKVVLNKSLERIGKELPKDIEPGVKSVGEVQKLIGQEYDRVLPNVTFTPDQQLVQEVMDIQLRQIKLLPPDMRQQWQARLDELTSYLQRQPNTNRMGMDGLTWKARDSELGYDAQRYLKSQNPDQHKFGKALSDLQGRMREALERSNPQAAQELKNVNDAWAIYKRAEGASIRRAKSNGIFSAADLLTDIRSSTPRGVYARGDGLMQDLARAANEVLPPEVPESGTMTRRLWSELLFSAGGIGGAYEYGGAPGRFAAGTLATGVGAGSLYAKPAVKAINKAATGIPRAAATANENLPLLGPPAAIEDIYEQGQK